MKRTLLHYLRKTWGVQYIVVFNSLGGFSFPILLFKFSQVSSLSFWIYPTNKHQDLSSVLHNCEVRREVSGGHCTLVTGRFSQQHLFGRPARHVQTTYIPTYTYICTTSWLYSGCLLEKRTPSTSFLISLTRLSFFPRAESQLPFFFFWLQACKEAVSQKLGADHPCL